MTTDIFTLTATDGHALYAKHWLPDDAPKAILVIIHGFYEHLGRYEHVAQGFIDQGYGAYAIDQRGHGQTKGKRGHGVLSQVLNDIETLLMHVRAEHTTIPIILYGHSWGGCNVSHFLLRKTTNELSGAILSSPWLRLALIPPKGKERLGNIMAKIWPSLTVANQLAPGSLSRDPAVEKAYLDDPLVHIKISAGIFKEITDVGPWIIDHAPDLKVKTLVMHGDADPVIDFKGSEEFANNAGDMAIFHPWPSLRHEPHNEPEQKQVIERMLAFCDEIIAK